MVLGATVAMTGSSMLDNVLVNTQPAGTPADSGLGNGAGWAVRLMASLVLNNSTLARNDAYNTGGCLYLAESAEATIQDSSLDSCNAVKGGGSVMMVQATCMFTGNVSICNSSTLQGSGGGLSCTNSEIRLLGPGALRVESNHATINGGGLLLAESCNVGPGSDLSRRSLLSAGDMEIVFANNSASWHAGAVSVGPFSYLTLLSGASMENNRAGKMGGAVHVQPSGGLVIGGDGDRPLVFRHNSAAGSGGAVFASADASLSVTNASFVGNIGGQDGGAVYLDQNVVCSFAIPAFTALALFSPL